MKRVLHWTRANLLTVVSIAVGLAAAPALLMMSSSRMAAVKDDAQREIGELEQDLQQARYNYSWPALLPSRGEKSVSIEPNAATTELTKRYLEALSEAADAVYAGAVERNRRGLGELVEGLLPAPDDRRKSELLQLAKDKWIAAHEEMLRGVNAAAPPDPEMVREELFARRALWLRDQGLNDEDEEVLLTEEDQALLTKVLSAERQRIYGSHANELAFYADMSVFTGVTPWVDNALPSLAQVWEWQWRSWIHAKALGALARANTNEAEGFRFTPKDGAVKRVLRLDAPAWSYEGRPAAARPINPTAPLQANYEFSFTGLNPSDGLYDLRYATVQLLVDSERVPRVLEAFSAENFMGVVYMAVTDYPSAWDDVYEGYVYGGDSVVMLTLTVETAWLREWTSERMPEEVRSALGVPQAPVQPGVMQ